MSNTTFDQSKSSQKTVCQKSLVEISSNIHMYHIIIYNIPTLSTCNSVVELSFKKGRVQTDSVRARCTRIFDARAYEAFLSGSKGHFNIESLGPV